MEIVALLPNVSVTTPIGDERIALLDPAAAEVDGALNTDHYRVLAERVRDDAGRPTPVSVLAVADGMASEPQAWSRILAFRNVVAAACVCHANECTLSGSPGGSRARWSDYFALYPYSFSNTGSGHLVTLTPAMRNLEHIDEFAPGTNPALPHEEIHGADHMDQHFFATLINAWDDHFSRGDDGDATLRRVFRSLEVANMASSLPFANQGTLHDYGMRLALWTSAMEVLVSDGGNEQKTIDRVLGGAVTASDKANQVQVYHQPTKGPPTATNLLQELRRQIWKVRNDFMHGNEVSISSLFAWSHRGGAFLPTVAATLYPLLVLEYLNSTRAPSDSMEEHVRWRRQQTWLHECTEAVCRENASNTVLGFQRKGRES